MEKNSNELALLSISPDKITKQHIQAVFNTKKIKDNYAAILNGLKSLNITKENLREEYPELKAATKLVSTLDTWRKDQAETYAAIPKLFLEVHKEFAAPIEDELNIIRQKVAKASAENKAEKDKAAKETLRIETIKAQMGNFINKITSDIANATDDDEIVAIQMRIGSEKSRKNFYAEFIGEFSEKCNLLKYTINLQKEKIRELVSLKNSFVSEMANGNDDKAVELRTEIELKEFEIEENSIRLQEKAFDQALNISDVHVGIPDVVVTKPKMKKWKWKVDDINKLSKRFTKIIVDEDEVNNYMAELRNEGLIKTNAEDFKKEGITFYKEIFY